MSRDGLFFLYILLNLFFLGAANAREACLATTDSGQVKGIETGTVCSFKGIPYAAPPIGPLRWKPPAPVIPWKTVRDTIDYGQSCLQTAYSGDAGSDVVGSEDCLTLNIWTPAKVPLHVPVMVWIHGGYSNWGSSSKRSMGVYRYDGKYLAEHAGVIIVSMNYRLGPLGFLSTPQLSSETAYHGSGNYGHMDQIAALEWVKRNISNFGGDPSKVTIFGHSAGGTSVAALLSSPRAKGLFWAAIQMSGGYPFRSLKRMEAYGFKLVKALGCEKPSSPKQAALVNQCMRAKPASELLTEFPEALEHGGAFYKTAIDGFVLPKSTKLVFEAGEQNDVPLITGTTADEEATLIGHFIGRGLPRTDTEYRSYLEKFFSIFDMGKLVGTIYDRFPSDRFPNPAQALIKVTTEWDMTCPNRRFLRSASTGPHKSSYYRYFYTHIFHDSPEKELGAAHGLELPYIFHVFPLKAEYTPDPFELNMSNALMAYWTSFAKTRVPSQLGLPSWPNYSIESDPYQELDSTITSRSELLSEDCDFWDKLNSQHWGTGSLTAMRRRGMN